MRAELDRLGISVFERGWLSSNSVLLRGDGNRGDVVVDTGYWTHAAQTVALLRQGLGRRPLSRVLNTHLHSDHCGGNAAVQRAFGCAIDVPAGEAAAVDRWDMSLLTYEATGQHCPRFSRDGVLHAAATVAAGQWDWQLVASPGHDPLSLALYQPEIEVLISADALWENGFGVVFPELEGGRAFDDVRRTLEAFSRLRTRWVIPGHGQTFSDLHGAIARALRRLDLFEKNPARHAAHAAKVLIKFHLLEVQTESWSHLLAWIHRARYFEIVHHRYFGVSDADAWVRSLVADMCQRRVLEATSDGLRNL